MSDPRRLLDEGADDFEARLLAAGRHDAPSRAGRRRILAGLGVGGVLTVATATSSASASSSGFLAGLGKAALKHWGISAAVGGAAVWAGVRLARPDPEPAPVPARVVDASRAKPVEVAPNAPALEAALPAVPAPAEPAVPAEAAPKRAANAVAPKDSSAKDASALSEELTALEGARRALVARDARRALGLLDDYGRRFAKPRLGTEASVLRIEALIASGDRARATQLAKAFLEKHTNGPYERRVRSLLVGLTDGRGRAP